MLERIRATASGTLYWQQNRFSQLVTAALRPSPHRLYTINNNVERNPYDRQGGPQERSDRPAGFTVSRLGSPIIKPFGQALSSQRCPCSSDGRFPVTRTMKLGNERHAVSEQIGRSIHLPTLIDQTIIQHYQSSDSPRAVDHH